MPRVIRNKKHQVRKIQSSNVYIIQQFELPTQQAPSYVWLRHITRPVLLRVRVWW